MLTEKEKYEKVWRECGRYGKDWTDRGLGRRYKEWFNERAFPAARVNDWGCGNGTSIKWLNSCGYFATGIEIAANAIITNRNDIYVGDLRKESHLVGVPMSDFGLCTDLMEHLPTSDVDRALKNISKRTRHGVLFGIARLPDKDGAALGLTLHLTIADKEWWDSMILKHFKEVEELRYNDGAYICWGWNVRK
jgi:2-polyprenyl-3-methyl-5-hydroxy-6-metoxy-1,4-benzoquinol methylase